MQVYPPRVLRDMKSSKFSISSDGTFIAHLMGGSDLFVFVLDTMEHLHTFRAGSKLVDFCFSPSDRNIIYAIADNGAVYTWDLRRRGEQSYFFDDGCVRATCFAPSSNGQFIACGTNTGIVNVYETSKALSSNFSQTGDQGEGAMPAAGSPKPLYTITNLTTSALFVKFNHDAQLMAFGSSVKYMAGRILHCRSGNVFQNFPSRPEMFSKERMKCAEFSPNSGFFAFGTESGACRLYRLNHFSNY